MEQATQTRGQNQTSEQQQQQQVVGQIPETVDDFLRNFLLRLGLVRTLDSFQREWYHIKDHKQSHSQDQNQSQNQSQDQDQSQNKSQNHRGFVPDALTQRSLIQSELAQVRVEAGLLRGRACELKQTEVRLMSEREFHRSQSSHAEDQKRALWSGLTQLREYRRNLDHTLTALTRGHEAALRTRTLAQARIQEDGRVPQTLQIQSEASARGRSHGQRTDASGPDMENNETKHQQKPSERRRTVRRRQETGDIREEKRPHTGERDDQVVTCDPGLAHFTLACPIRAHYQPISDIEVHPIRHLLVTSSDDRSWRLWELPTANQEQVGALLLSGEGHSDWLTSCSFSLDGDKLATTSGDATVRVWDLGRGCCLLSLRGHLGATWGCCFHRSGGSLASASSDRTVRLWDGETGRSLATLRRHRNAVSSVHFLPRSDHFLLSSSRDRTLVLWDQRGSTCTATMTGHAHPVEHCTSHPAGRVVASCDSGGVVKLWDVRSLRSELASAHTTAAGANQVSLRPGTGSDGEEVAVAGGDGLVRLLRPASGHMIEIGAHLGRACSVRFDHQGETLLSAGEDGIVRVWRRS